MIARGSLSTEIEIPWSSTKGKGREIQSIEENIVLYENINTSFV